MSLSEEEIQQDFAPYEVKSFHTGSNYICNPPIENTDIDYMVLCNTREEYDKIFCLLYDKGYKYSGDYFEDKDEAFSFVSFKKEINGKIINYIITHNLHYYTLFYEATQVAKKLNLREKQQRIDLFNYILYEVY